MSGLIWMVLREKRELFGWLSVAFWRVFCMRSREAEAILLEALEIVLGQPTGNHMKYFPFKSLPTYSSEAFW